MRILIGGGGTGGHIYPGLSLARYARQTDPETEILFVGSAKGMESTIVPQAGFKLLTIPASGFRRDLKGFGRTIKDLAGGIKEAAKIIDDFKPQVILGTGGYVAAPLMAAGLFKKCPLVLHEQNALPGLTNRWLAPFVKRVCISFAGTEKNFSRRAKISFTGNPRAAEVTGVSSGEAYKKFGLSPDKKVLLIYGGSRGAQRINEVVTAFIKNKLYPEDLAVIYVTGDIYFDEVKEKLSPLPLGVKLFSYLEEMPLALSLATLVLTRSGATTLAEITALGLPAILVPSPNVVNNHQYYNARLLSDRAAAELIEEKDFDEQKLAQIVREMIIDPARLHQMAANSKALGVLDAAKRLYTVLQEVAS